MLCVQADEWTEGGVVLRGPQLLFLRCLLERWEWSGFVVSEGTLTMTIGMVRRNREKTKLLRKVPRPQILVLVDVGTTRVICR